MNESARRMRDALGVVAIWAITWGAAGVRVRVADPRRSLDELWLGPAIGVQPGLLAGVLFCAALAMWARRRGAEPLSVTAVLARGAVAGLLVGVLPFAINEPSGPAPAWLMGVVVAGSTSVLGAASACVSRMATKRLRPAVASHHPWLRRS